jgi:hypothetical protein
MKDIVVNLLTTIVMLSPLWGAAWLLVHRGRRRRAATAAYTAARADAEQTALWEARKVGPFGSENGITASVFVARVARLHQEEWHVGIPATVATLRARTRVGDDNSRFLADVDEAMNEARALAADLNVAHLM